ncbi:MAG: alcohol dehydrogenase catalytic domain-containing protein, partial [Myxococcota bacterium]
MLTSKGIGHIQRMATRRRCLMLNAAGVELEEHPISQAVDPGHVRVALVMAGICRTDLAVARGALEVRRPRILGHEAAGVVVQADGSTGAHLVGKPVAIDPRV